MSLLSPPSRQISVSAVSAHAESVLSAEALSLADKYHRLGIMTKLGGMKRNWRRRIFALDVSKKMLHYFRKSEDFVAYERRGNKGACAGSISLAGATVYIPDFLEDEDNALEITTAPPHMRHYFCKCDDDRELCQWITDISLTGVTFIAPRRDADWLMFVDPSPLSGAVVTFGKEGFMEKRGGFMTAYKKRFFRTGLSVDNKKVLTYYEKYDSLKAAGTIELQGINIETKSASLELELHTPGRVFQLRAFTELDFKEWSTILQEYAALGADQNPPKIELKNTLVQPVDMLDIVEEVSEVDSQDDDEQAAREAERKKEEERKRQEELKAQRRLEYLRRRSMVLRDARAEQAKKWLMAERKAFSSGDVTVQEITATSVATADVTATTIATLTVQDSAVQRKGIDLGPGGSSTHNNLLAVSLSAVNGTGNGTADDKNDDAPPPLPAFDDDHGIAANLDEPSKAVEEAERKAKVARAGAGADDDSSEHSYSSSRLYRERIRKAGVETAEMKAKRLDRYDKELFARRAKRREKLLGVKLERQASVREAAMFKELISAGNVLIKHGRKGKPHKKRVFAVLMGESIVEATTEEDEDDLDRLFTQIFWCAPDSKELKQHREKWVSIDPDVTKILRGKATEVFLRETAEHVNPEVCFSVVDEDRGRTLDLQCATTEERDEWVEALEWAIALHDEVF